MGPWDYLHCPPGTAHITIGAGDGPCAILMVGTRAPRRDDPSTSVEPAAARHGASVERRRDVAARGLRGPAADRAGALALAAALA